MVFDNVLLKYFIVNIFFYICNVVKLVLFFFKGWMYINNVLEELMII